MKITCKAKLLPFFRTKLKVALTEDKLNFKIASLETAPGVEKFTIDWGDGTSQEEISSTGLGHVFALPGVYEIRLSDDIAAMTAVDATEEMQFFSPCYLSFWSNATKLTTLKSQAFRNCTNLTTAEFAASEINNLYPGVFYGCTSLPSVIYMPKVNTFHGPGVVPPFKGCSQITELHFSAANEAAIKASTTWAKDKTIGTGTATCYFDP